LLRPMCRRCKVNGDAIAVRKTFFDIITGDANVEWLTSSTVTGGLFAYASQDGGSTWTPIANGVDFDVVAGTLDVIFVGNDGADTGPSSNGGLEWVRVSLAPIPEPASLVLFGLAGLGLLGRRRPTA